MTPKPPKRVRPAATRGTDRDRLGQPEAERERTQRKLRATDRTWRTVRRAAERQGCDLSTLVERWADAGCPMGGQS